MQIINRLDALKKRVGEARAGGGTLGLVPTMGALHAGHMALVDAAKAACDQVAVSIFVNPKQFGENEDLDAYPRQLNTDAEMCRDAGVDFIWAPLPEEMYPAGFSTAISVTGVSEGLCAGTRPGHFDGVALVVAKLLNQMNPTHAFFGEKDYQQVAVVRRMARDLDFALEIVGVPTIRDADGLALSSRNAYLSADQRRAAVALPYAMKAAIERLRHGEDVDTVLALARREIVKGGFESVDYIELRDSETLEPMAQYRLPARLIAAARIGPARLIDNMAV